ncbi:MAG: RHS repeat-associated core domain-containing protein, partial [Chryseobacterium sp.]
MRKIIILFSLLLASLPLHSQSNTENYVKSTDCFDADCIKKVVSVQYFDGLGRAKQVVNVKASPQQKDVVTPIIYDGFGRQTRDYLSVPQNSTTSGQIYPQSSNLVPFPVVDVTGVYANEKAYSEKILENSPLDRIRQQIQVGTAWSGKSVQFGYDINTAGEVNRYTTTTSWENGATKSTITKGTYTTDQLYKNTVTDEDGNVSIEFKDGKGQTILVRKMLDATTSADTYYIYNEYSQLAFVIPPMASETLKTMTPGSQVTELSLNDLCYQYRYDGRNRLVEKKLPGKGWEYMVYDKQDRLVLTQDAILRTTGNNFTRKGWIFTKYDQFGRVVYTGFFSNTASRAAIQNAINSMSANAGNNETRSSSPFALNGMEIYYTKNAFPTGSMTVLSVNYYDTYPLGSPSVPSDILGQAVLTQDSQSSDISTKSLPTISCVKNIEDDNWTKNYTWYDTNGRPIGSHSINHLGGYTKIESKLDFLGTPLQTITIHKRLNSDTERVIIENFTYDHQNRLLTHTHQVDNNPVEYLSQNAYNELSQLQSKKVGGTILGSGLQTVDYKYNIRGWMTHINDPQNLGTDLFGYKIKYNQVEGLQTPDASDTALQVVPRFNGNIAEIDWKTSTQENEPLKTYGYVYDNLNRLLAGFYQKSTSPSGREYYEKVTYDLNGNIKSMKRTSNQISPTASRVIDNLTYDYYSGNASNRLQKVTDVSQNSSGHPYRA